MRKNFTFLTAIFVCALMQVVALAQSQSNEVATAESAASITGSFKVLSDASDIPALSTSEIADQIADAKQLLKSQPAKATSAQDISVTLAALDPELLQIHIFSLPKGSFLVKGANLLATTQLGRTVRLHIVNANGVNTAVTVTDTATGRSLVPLVVEYPIEKGASVSETAYYTSAHPALKSPEIISAGKTYVTSMLATAAASLAEKGVTISPDIVDIAEHLCIVEHTDHKRFLNEDRAALFPEILALYALNQNDTYRYSISSAGAGGMIQMIPRTYEGIRQNHPTIDLNPDFVAGMRDHANALEAMLLYMQDTWNGLEQSPEVHDALRAGIATKTELLAAGYNSNPMRLPAYLKRGSTEWRTLIPAETQMYLTIYDSVDSNVQFAQPGTQETASDSSATAGQLGVTKARRSATTALMAWLSKELLSSGSFVRHILP